MALKLKLDTFTLVMAEVNISIARKIMAKKLKEEMLLRNLLTSGLSSLWRISFWPPGRLAERRCTFHAGGSLSTLQPGKR